jgi:hypothetical protein
MTAITFDKTWAVDEYLTSDVGVVAENVKEVLYHIKRMMCLHGWTVVASSNGTTADTNDNWNSRTDIVGATAGTAHSWIVLQNTAIAATFQVCFDMASATISSMSSAVSYSGAFSNFTSTLNRPTATDEAVILSVAQWHVNVDTQYAVTMYYSSDNKCNRIYFCPVGYHSSSAYQTFFIFDSPKDPASWWDEPWIAGVKFLAPTYINLNSSSSNSKLYTRINGTRCDLAWASWGTTSGAYGSLTSGLGQDYNGAYVLSPIPIISITAARPGIIGLVYDLYWVGNGLATASYIPTATGAKRLFTYRDVAQANDNNKRMP